MITLGSKTFRTKKQAASAVYDVLHAGELGRKLVGEEHELVRALLDRHPNAAQKIGCGVVTLYVRQCGFGSRCFWLRRSDGTETDFSYRECLTPDTHRTKVMAAMRHAVSDQVIRYKHLTFSGMIKVPCALSGELIGPDECDVDHFDPTFRVIVDEFFTVSGASVDDVELLPSGDGRLGDELADPRFAENWRAFHGTRARLRIVERKLHMARSRLSDEKKQIA